MKTIKNKSTRTFGVEIEFTSTHRLSTIGRQLQEKLATTNIFVHVENYNHNTRNHWKLVTDSSCGFELVSPILTGQEGMNDLHTIVTALETLNVKVNRNCGIHVHVGVEDATSLKIKNLVKYYIKNQKLIDSVMPNSRRQNNNSYCRNIEAYTPQTFKKLNSIHANNKRMNFSDEMSVSGFANHLSGRYRKLNLQSFRRYRTVEFRQHSASLCAKKITTWTAFCLNTVDKTFKMKAVQFACPSNSQDAFIELFGVKQNRKIMKHFEERALHFGFNQFEGSFDKGAAIRRF